MQHLKIILLGAALLLSSSYAAVAEAADKLGGVTIGQPLSVKGFKRSSSGTIYRKDDLGGIEGAWVLEMCGNAVWNIVFQSEVHDAIDADDVTETWTSGLQGARWVPANSDTNRTQDGQVFYHVQYYRNGSAVRAIAI